MSEPLGQKRRSIPSPILVLLVLIILSLACSISLTDSATNTPRPASTEAQAPADTKAAKTSKPAAVSKTPTEEPQAADTADATSADNSAAAEIQAALGKAKIPMGDGHVVFNSPAAVSLSQSTYNTSTYRMMNGTGDVMDFAMHSNVTWNTELGLSGCGWYFRIDQGGVNRGKYYAFYFDRLSGAPFYLVASIGYGVKTRNVGEGYSNLIDDKQDAQNEMLFVARKSEFQIFVNGQHVKTIYDNATPTKGGFALMASTESGETQCTFENTWIWSWDK